MNITARQRATRTITLTEEHVATYAKMTGDHNPLHFDKEFAARTKFGRLVVQGGLTTGLLHALVSVVRTANGSISASNIDLSGKSQ